MPKAKPGPALFELLEEDPKRPLGAADSVAPRAGHNRSDAGGALRMTPESISNEVGGECSSFIKLDGGCVRVSFTSLSAAVCAFCGLVALLGAYELGGHFGFRRGFQSGHEAGRDSYAARTMDEIEIARQEEPATDLVRSLLAAPSGAGREALSGEVADEGDSESPRWVRDFTYIVAQEFRADRLEDVEPAREFLAQRGLATAVVRLPSGAVQLVTTQGYNHNNQTQRRLGEQLLHKEHDIGAEYYASGGGYRLEGYFKTLKSDSW